MAFPRVFDTAEVALEGIAFLLELLAVLVILSGVGLGVFKFLTNFTEAGVAERGRVSLVKATIFGLDILVAADIIRTAITPNLPDLALLAGIVAIRIVLTFVLTREMRHLDERERQLRESQPPTRSAKSDAAM